MAPAHEYLSDLQGRGAVEEVVVGATATDHTSETAMLDSWDVVLFLGTCTFDDNATYPRSSLKLLEEVTLNSVWATILVRLQYTACWTKVYALLSSL